MLWVQLERLNLFSLWFEIHYGPHVRFCSLLVLIFLLVAKVLAYGQVDKVLKPRLVDRIEEHLVVVLNHFKFLND